MERNTEKTVLKKMVLMYIRENINTNIKHTLDIEKIVEDIVKELVNNGNAKTPIYIDMPVNYSIVNDCKREIKENTSRPTSQRLDSSQNYFCWCIRRQSILYMTLMTIYEKLFNQFNNQDTYQRALAISSILFESFRAITSSLMILFIPQSCDGDVCTFNQLLQVSYELKGVGIVINFITLLSFTVLYWIEMWRENRLIKYLEVNPNLPTDLEYISTILDILPEEKKKKLYTSNLYYRYITYITIIIYIINAVISGIVINRSILASQTYSNYVTYVIFMITKLSNAYGVVYSYDNIYYSAYLKTNIQFNDIDRKYKKIIDL
jgi:hypothetical protein